MIWITILAVFVVVGSVNAYVRELKRDNDVLRHTIAVNLSILQPELVSLQAVAANTASSADVEEAKRLLSESDAAATSARAQLDLAKRKVLDSLLPAVFDAMSKATRARHLLHACRPMSEFPLRD